MNGCIVCDSDTGWCEFCPRTTEIGGAAARLSEFIRTGDTEVLLEGLPKRVSLTVIYTLDGQEEAAQLVEELREHGYHPDAWHTEVF